MRRPLPACRSVRSCAPRAIGVLLGLEGSQNPFSGTPTYQSIAHLPLAERVRRMRDPEFRAQMLSEDPKKDSTFPLFHRLRSRQMFRFGNPPNYQPRREDSLAAIAEREGRTPQEVAYDVLLEDDGNAFIYTPLGNYADYDLSVSRDHAGGSQYASWAWAMVARMSRSFSMPAIRPGC